MDDALVDSAARRVTVRHRLPRPRSAGGGPDRFADVVGQLVAGPAGPVVVRPDGSRVPVRPDRVVAVRDVPPVAPRVAQGTDLAAPDRAARDAEALDRLAASHWQAPEQEPLGQWVLRAAGGFTRRANSTLAVGDPGVPLPAALDRVARWYLARELTPRVSVGDPAVVEAAVAAGWSPEVTTAVMTARVVDVLGALPDGWADAGPSVRLDAAPDTAWLADHRDAGTHPSGAAVLRAPAGTTGLFATLAAPLGTSPEGVEGLAGRGRAIVSDGWVGLSWLGIHPLLRRRGLGRLVVATLLDAALDAGAVRCWLQVEVDDATAMAFHRSAGFRTDHETVYLRPAQPQTTTGEAR